MTRVRDEVSAAMRDDMHPTREHIRRMPFLACVIKESELLDAKKKKSQTVLTARSP